MRARTLVYTGTAPLRLDTFVHAMLPLASRRIARRVIAEGAARVNGQRGRKGTLLAPGDRVTLPDLPGLDPEPGLPVPLVHEDAHLVVVDKPGGMPGHALDPRQRSTVAAFLLGRYPETARVGHPLAPGLVHRLDTGTSGLLAAARSADVFASLRRAWRAGAVRKRYLAVVDGHLSAPTRVTLPLAHDSRDRRRMVRAAPGQRSWQARTDVEPLGTQGRFLLVAATMRTGVTHQIRVHLAALGCPVVGDALYGSAGDDLPVGRHALHAAELELAHPTTQERLVVRSSLPADLAALA